MKFPRDTSGGNTAEGETEHDIGVFGQTGLPNDIAFARRFDAPRSPFKETVRNANFDYTIQANRSRARQKGSISPFYTLVVFSLFEGLSLILLASMLAVAFFGINSDFTTRHISAGGLVSGTYVFLQLFCGLGDPEWLTKLRERAMKSLQMLALAGGLVVFLAFALKISSDLSRLWVASYFFLCFFTILLNHAFLRVTRRSFLDRLPGERVALYSFSPQCAAIADQFMQPASLYRFVGVYDDRKERRPASCKALPCEGSLQTLIEDAQAGLIDSVIICLDINAKNRVRDVLRKLRAASVSISFAPLLRVEHSLTLSPRTIGQMMVMDLAERPLSRWAGMTKWLEDRVIASLGLILLAPLMAMIAILIKLTSPGPVFFRQPRFGFNNRPFQVLKFRTMHASQQDVSGAMRTQRGDPRVTWIGRILRRTSLDETPQLFNVLRGEMSIVGPRPHAVEMRVDDHLYHERFIDYASRHRVKPGLTGWAQINGSRGEVDTHEKARRRILLDLYYIRNWSLLLDIWIVMRTAVTLVFGRNAY